MADMTKWGSEISAANSAGGKSVMVNFVDGAHDASGLVASYASGELTSAR
jgi:hypothetical protein